jgi:hypothetical protein
VQGVDLGAIASSLSPTVGALGEALERVCSSASWQHLPLSSPGRSFFQRVYVTFAGNSDLCLSFLRLCVDYGEKVFTWYPSSITLPTSSREGVTHDLREQTTKLLSEATSVPSENAPSVQGLSSYRSTPLIPITDIRGYYCLLFTRIT